MVKRVCGERGVEGDSADTLQYCHLVVATEAVSMHPTRMHCCWTYLYVTTITFP